MITKEKISELIKTVREFNGMITLNYVPESVIYSEGELSGLYYSGQYKIEIGKYYQNFPDFYEVTDDNFELTIEKIYNCLKDNVGSHIIQALENLYLDDCDIKYFDRDPELLINFQQEVLRLKNTDNTDIEIKQT